MLSENITVNKTGKDKFSLTASLARLWDIDILKLKFEILM